MIRSSKQSDTSSAVDAQETVLPTDTQTAEVTHSSDGRTPMVFFVPTRLPVPFMLPR